MNMIKMIKFVTHFRSITPAASNTNDDWSCSGNCEGGRATGFVRHEGIGSSTPLSPATGWSNKAKELKILYSLPTNWSLKNRVVLYLVPELSTLMSTKARFMRYQPPCKGMFVQ